MMLTKAELTMVKSLGDKRARIETGLFVAEGRKIVSELVGSDFEVEAVYVRSGAESLIGLPCSSVSAKEMERMSQLKTPTDYLAVIKIPANEVASVDPARELVLMLDEVQDPGNMGTIVRLADWFGVRNIVCSMGTADIYNPKVVQATMGAFLRVKIHYCALDKYLSGIGKASKTGKIPVYGAFLEGENIYDSELSPNGIVIMGNEGKGISESVSRFVTNKIYIPPFPTGQPTAESLNVATATAVICSEFRRRMK